MPQIMTKFKRAVKRAIQLVKYDKQIGAGAANILQMALFQKGEGEGGGEGADLEFF